MDPVAFALWLSIIAVKFIAGATMKKQSKGSADPLLATKRFHVPQDDAKPAVALKPKADEKGDRQRRKLDPLNDPTSPYYT